MLHHPSHITVEPGDHRRLSFVLIRPILFCIRSEIRHLGTMARKNQRVSPLVAKQNPFGLLF